MYIVLNKLKKLSFLHGVIFKDNLRFGIHVNIILKQCSQRSFLMKQLHSQGLSNKQLITVFDVIILSRLRMLYQQGWIFIQGA